MKDFTSPTVRSLKPSGIRAFFDLASSIQGCISLGVGEPDYDTPWHVTEMATEAAACGQTFYTSNQGMPSLREAILKWNKENYGLEYQDNEVLVTVGASEAIDVAIRACIGPGEEVIVPEPCYVCYSADVILAGGVPKPLPLKDENQFRITPEELEAAITPKTKAIILNYPNNPTGAIMTKEDWEKIIPILIKHDLLLISDEIYSELTYSGHHISPASFPGMKERTIYINGFSKAYSMTGWRLGYALAPASIMAQMIKIHQFTIMCAPTIAQFAGLEALKHGEEDVIKMRKDYDHRRHFMMEEFKRIGISCFEPLGAFYLFPYIGDFGMTSEEFCVDLLNKEKLIVVPGTAFGDSGEGFVRISYAYSEKALKEAVQRLERYLNTLRK